MGGDWSWVLLRGERREGYLFLFLSRRSGCFSVSVLFISWGLARRRAGFSYGSFFVMILLAMGPGGCGHDLRGMGLGYSSGIWDIWDRGRGRCKIRYTV